jgi:hypothetical protein
MMNAFLSILCLRFAVLHEALLGMAFCCRLISG